MRTGSTGLPSLQMVRSHGQRVSTHAPCSTASVEKRGSELTKAAGAHHAKVGGRAHAATPAAATLHARATAHHLRVSECVQSTEYKVQH